MSKVRFFIALWAAKLSVIALKITRHNGTNFPGVVALKLCPDFLKIVKKPKKIIGVTGTNGKTTICNLAIDMFSTRRAVSYFGFPKIPTPRAKAEAMPV